MTNCAADHGSLNQELRAALKVALPYVESIASRCPTAMNNVMRTRQAIKDRDYIRDVLAKGEDGDTL